MNDSLAMFSRPTIPADADEFASDKGIRRYLDPIIDLAQQSFAPSPLHVSLGYDVEDETHQYIAIDVEVGDQTMEELLAGQRMWSAGITRLCPSRHAVYFVLGWR